MSQSLILGLANRPIEKNTPSVRRKIKISHSWTLREKQIMKRTRHRFKKRLFGHGQTVDDGRLAELDICNDVRVVRRKFLRPLEKQQCKPDFLQPEIGISQIKADGAVVCSRRQDLFIISPALS